MLAQCWVFGACDTSLCVGLPQVDAAKPQAQSSADDETLAKADTAAAGEQGDGGRGAAEAGGLRIVFLRVFLKFFLG